MAREIALQGMQPEARQVRVARAVQVKAQLLAANTNLRRELIRARKIRGRRARASPAPSWCRT
jgi:hypothetical protein